MAANVFISHTAADKDVADALGDAIDRLFRSQVTASYSTRRGEGAIAAGENWFDWIGRQVRTSQVTVVLLSPNPVNKKWVLWETGAIYGAATALEGSLHRRLRPL